MSNKETIRIQIEKVEKTREELLIEMKFERGRNKHRKLEKQLQFKDGILAGLKWAFGNVK